MAIPTLDSNVPAISLPDRSGRQVSLEDIAAEGPLIILFCDDCPEKQLQAFARHYPRYQRAGAELLAVVGRPPAVALPYPVLMDVTGEVTEQFVKETPELLLVDDNNYLYCRQRGPWYSEAEHRRLLDWVRQIRPAWHAGMRSA